MTDNTFIEPIEETPGNSHVPAAQTTPSPERPTVTFMGNTYDLTSLGALASGLLLMFMCLTCNMGFYCLPFIPMIMGAIGLLTARQAVDSERTKLWSWIGLGLGGVVLMLIATAVFLYFGLVIVTFLASGEMSY